MLTAPVVAPPSRVAASAASGAVASAYSASACAARGGRVRAAWPRVSLSASIARVPLPVLGRYLNVSFPRFIVGLLMGDRLYRFATYTGAVTSAHNGACACAAAGS